VIKIETNMGEIILELDDEKAPVSTANFKEYVKDGFYEGTIFHRVIDGFMVQGGGLDENLENRQTRPPIKNEADNGLKNDMYTVAMARTNDPDSATAQFFVNVADNQFLNHQSKTAQGWGYAVFGKVVEGMDVVDKMKAVPTTTKSPYDDVPVEAIVILSAAEVESA